MTENTEFIYVDNTWQEKTGPNWNDRAVTEDCALLPQPFYRKGEIAHGLHAYFPYRKGLIQGVHDSTPRQGEVHLIWAKPGPTEAGISLIVCYTTVHKGHVGGVLVSDQLSEWIPVDLTVPIPD